MAEKLDIPDREWKAQEYLPKEWDEKGGRDGRGGPRRKVGWQPDVKKNSQEYREGYDRIFGKKD